eukprot:CAMPEP_0194186242 /NCGR_PEP_ID=MMETSP0154-20130528/46182_1 /TAXON_ID=1049557 /ORGANISM="Thalassiothrix antarctica, Strain L6-D1" /LENGTH=269 /DNA_ID=CAMNT_0038905153 /DNA_START=706 /DNA_END=1511 /DNA_ORIENTATION=-
MNPFDVTPTLEKYPLSKTTSFCVSENKEFHRSQIQKKKVFSVISACIEPEYDSFVIHSRGLEEELFYDSDPGEISRKRLPTKSSQQPRKSSISIKVREEEKIHSGEKCLETSNDVTKINPNGMFQSEDLVQEILNQRYTFVLHPDKLDEKPMAVVAWFERGQQLQHYLVQPRFVWTKLYEESSSSSKIRISEINDRQSIDLLDIARVLEVNHVNRKKYPLAKSKKCLLIQCLEMKIFFEASSEKVRDKICDDIKLVVARLGSKIIMEDA